MKFCVVRGQHAGKTAVPVYKPKEPCTGGLWATEEHVNRECWQLHTRDGYVCVRVDGEQLWLPWSVLRVE